MIDNVLTLLIYAAKALGAFFGIRRRAQTQARKKAIEGAVRSGDRDAVTRIHNDLLRSLLLAAVPALSLLGSGCAAKERLVVVNQPMVPVRMEHGGSPGWWLSDSLYEATLLRLDALKTETETERN